MTFPGHCPGKVFWSRQAVSGHGIHEFTTNWKQIFASTVRINGSQGNLEILGCNEDFISVMHQLRYYFAPFPKISDFQQNDSMGWGIIKEKRRVVRILALGLKQQGQSIVFILSQSKNNFDKSLTPPNTHYLQEMLVYPGSVVKTFVEVNATQAQLEISAVPGIPKAIKTFFQSTFAGRGWKQMTLSMDSNKEFSNMIIYQKGFEICCVMIRESGQPYESIITVLHKRFSME